MKVNSHKLNRSQLPDVLRQIPNPPKQLFYSGTDLSNLLKSPSLAVVGSRKISPYGQQVTQKLVEELARLGVIIVSGLALGVDYVAHKTAIEAGSQTIAVLPSPLSQIYPASHLGLAKQIIDTGGTLISEYADGAEVYRLNFIERNRLVSGLADGLLITEAARNSGTMHTAGFALEQGKTVMAVPGNINSPGSEGTNNLIKRGAVPVTDIDDILFALNLQPVNFKKMAVFKGSAEEQTVFDLIKQGINNQDELAAKTNWDGAKLNQALTMLELNGYVRAHGGNWVLI